MLSPINSARFPYSAALVAVSAEAESGSAVSSAVVSMTAASSSARLRLPHRAANHFPLLFIKL